MNSKKFETIDWFKERQRDNLTKKQIFSSGDHQAIILENIQGYLIVAVIGIFIGIISASIDISSAWLSGLKTGFCKSEWYLSRRLCCINQSEDSCREWQDWSVLIIGFENIFMIRWLVYVFFSALFATLAAFSVSRTSPQAAGSGSPEIKTILGGFNLANFFNFKTLVTKSLTVPLTVASGLAVGKEGPMIHVSCCIGELVQSYFPGHRHNEALNREILSCSVAAGIASAFGSPIGGVLFSMEEVSSFFSSQTMLKSFICALISFFTLEFMNPYRDTQVLYQVTYTQFWHFFEIPFFIFLGVFGGLSGAVFVRLNLIAQDWRIKLFQSSHPVLQVFYTSLFTAFFFFLSGYTRIDGGELLAHLFRECSDSNFNGICDESSQFSTILGLVAALTLRIIFTILCVGIMVPAGIFIPSMIWGALFGRIVGIMVDSFQTRYKNEFYFSSCLSKDECVSPGMYALIGSMAALGGVTRLTVSLVVIMFELTGSLNYVLPTMIAIMTSKLVGDAFGKGSYADLIIKRNQYPFLDTHSEKVYNLNANDIMTSFFDLVCLKQNSTLNELSKLVYFN